MPPLPPPLPPPSPRAKRGAAPAPSPMDLSIFTRAPDTGAGGGACDVLRRRRMGGLMLTTCVRTP
eukprot:364612-Chlamydomonas_euryale.AAC.21